MERGRRASARPAAILIGAAMLAATVVLSGAEARAGTSVAGAAAGAEGSRESAPATAVFGKPGALTEPTSPADSAKAVVHRFHAALAAGDSARAVSLLHPDAVIYESGHAETREEYAAGHLKADMEFTAAVEREILEERVSVYGSAALYESRDRISGTFRGREVEGEGVETVVLVRTPDGWRIRHVHWSSR